MQTALKLLKNTAPAVVIACFSAGGANAQPVGGTNIDASSAVAVVVKVPKPWYAPKSAVVGKMKETIPVYQSLPGLAYKAFSIASADNQYGGIYLWKDESSARSFFNQTWFDRIEKERGVKGHVQLYEVPVAIDNTNHNFKDDGNAVATVVLVSTPKGITKSQLVQEFRASIPTYRKIPGLLRKYFVTADGDKFGGIYIWKDESSAQQWLNDSWHERIVKTYGVPASIEWFDTPILLPSIITVNQPLIPGL